MTDFIDMPVGTRRSWLIWAREHDWGRDAVMTTNGFMTGLVMAYTAANGAYGEERRSFTNPADLRAWAGY